MSIGVRVTTAPASSAHVQVMGKPLLTQQGGIKIACSPVQGLEGVKALDRLSQPMESATERA